MIVPTFVKSMSLVVFPTRTVPALLLPKTMQQEEAQGHIVCYKNWVKTSNDAQKY